MEADRPDNGPETVLAKKTSTIRVFELARELGVTSKDLIAKCEAEDIPKITNHMSTMSLGLAATVREWFGEGGPTTTIAAETSAPVDVVRARAKAKKKKKVVPEPTVVPDQPATTVVTLEPVEPPVVEPTVTEPTVTEPPVAPTPVAPMPVAPMPVAPMPVAPMPVSVPEPVSAPPPPDEPPPPPETPDVPEAPALMPLAPAAEAPAAPEAPAPPPKVAPNIPTRPVIVAPAGPRLEQPSATKLAGPKVIRVETPEPVHHRRPIDRRPADTIRRGGPRAGRGAGVGYQELPEAPSDKPARLGGRTTRRNKRRTATARDDAGRTAKVAPTTDQPFNWRTQDLREREARLNRAGGFFKAHRRDLKRSAGGGVRGSARASLALRSR